MAQSSSTTITSRQGHYFVPQPMPWPILGSTALFCMILGGVFVMNGSSGGWVSIAVGLMILIFMMFRWFGDVIRESEGGKYGGWEDLSFRWGMSWFIFSEVSAPCSGCASSRCRTSPACRAIPTFGPGLPAIGPRQVPVSKESFRRWGPGASRR